MDNGDPSKQLKKDYYFKNAISTFRAMMGPFWFPTHITFLAGSYAFGIYFLRRFLNWLRKLVVTFYLGMIPGSANADLI